MSGPWEKYQSADGPWTKYQQTETSVNEAPEQSRPFLDQVESAAKDVLSVPGRVARNLTPEKMSPYAPAAGAIAGSAFAPGLGTAAGAGVGQILSRMADIAYGRAEPSSAMSPAKEAIAPMVQTAVGGLPEVSGVLNPAKRTLSQVVGKAAAKFGQTITGAKQDVLEQAAKQGYSTYRAPSLEKAQKIFGSALGPEGQAATKVGAEQAFDPALGQARKLATDIGMKIEAGKPISAVEALKARQATDRVISSTPFWDKKTRSALYDWRTTFDKAMQEQSGPLKSASTTYRKAIVKDQLLNPTRINKHGEPSALLPMLAGIAGPLAGFESGHTGKGTLAATGYLAATSPLAAGAIATTAGAINPTARAALIAEFVRRMSEKAQQ